MPGKTLLLFFLMLATSACPLSAGEKPDSDVLRASSLFETNLKEECAEHAFDGRQFEPQKYEIHWRSSYEEASAPEKTSILYEFFCENFAHSGSAAYVIKSPDGKFGLASFARPYVDKNGLAGLYAENTLLNPEFIAGENTLSTSDHLGNMEFYSKWIFREGIFVFVEDQEWRITDKGLEKQPDNPAEP